MDLKETLKNTRLFYDLSDPELEEVSFSVTLHEYPSNAIIINEGTTTQTLYIIKEGNVSIEIPLGHDYLQLATLNPGDFFGEMGLILALPHSASVRSVDKTAILQMQRPDLDVILHWNTLLASKLWRSFSEVLAERVLETNKKLKLFFESCQTHLTEIDSKNLKDLSKGIFK